MSYDDCDRCNKNACVVGRLPCEVAVLPPPSSQVTRGGQCDPESFQSSLFERFYPYGRSWISRPFHSLNPGGARSQHRSFFEIISIRNWKSFSLSLPFVCNWQDSMGFRNFFFFFIIYGWSVPYSVGTHASMREVTGSIPEWPEIFSRRSPKPFIQFRSHTSCDCQKNRLWHVKRLVLVIRRVWIQDDDKHFFYALLHIAFRAQIDLIVNDFKCIMFILNFFYFLGLRSFLKKN